MKKIFVLMFAGICMLAGCKEENYDAEIEERCEQFNASCNELMSDPDLSESQKDSRINMEIENAKSDISAIVGRALKKHDNDTTAVKMICLMASYELTDNEGVLNAIGKLGPEAKSSPEIKGLLASLEQQSRTAEGSQFVDFTIVQPDGRKVSLSDFAGKGKYCLVDFWASWCGPCKKEIPNLKAVYDKYSKKGLNMVSVAVWDNPVESIDTAKAYGVCWSQILNAQSVPTELYNIQGIPHIMLIGPDGTILKRDLRGKEIARAVGEYL